jgi:hypothetical protein
LHFFFFTNSITIAIFIIFIVAPYILKSILFTHQQMHYLLNLERFKIYTKIHTNITPTCFSLQPSSGSLYWAWLKLLEHMVKLYPYRLCGDVAACLGVACVLCAMQYSNFYILLLWRSIKHWSGISNLYESNLFGG